VLEPASEDGASKATSRQSSIQMVGPTDSITDDDQQTLNLKHLSEAITTLTAPPVSWDFTMDFMQSNRSNAYIMKGKICCPP